MNDMSRPNAAARLSEDIGDVLSAIRRLIADDDALTEAREQQRGIADAAPVIDEQETMPVAVGGDLLAHRHGGNAALARQMAGRSLSAVPAMRGDGGRSAGIQAAAMRAIQPAPTSAELEDDDADADADEWFVAIDGSATPTANAPMIPDAAPAAGPEPVPAQTTGAALVPKSAHLSAPPVALRPQPIVPRRAGTLPAAPPLRLGAAQRVVPTGDDDGAGQRLHIPWRAWTPAPTSALRAQPMPAPEIRTNSGADAPSGFAGSRLSPMALARSLTDLDDGADAVVQPHHMPADPAQADFATDPVVDFDTLMAAMLSEDADDASAAPDLAESVEEPADAAPFEASEAVETPDVVAAPAEAAAQPQRVADHADEIDADPAPSVGAGAAAEPTVQAPIMTGLEIDLMDEDEADLLIRKTIRAMIQEELHGELGERFSRNLRAVIRREIAAAIDDQMDRF